MATPAPTAPVITEMSSVIYTAERLVVSICDLQIYATTQQEKDMHTAALVKVAAALVEIAATLQGLIVGGNRDHMATPTPTPTSTSTSTSTPTSMLEEVIYLITKVGQLVTSIYDLQIHATTQKEKDMHAAVLVNVAANLQGLINGGRGAYFF